MKTRNKTQSRLAHKEYIEQVSFALDVFLTEYQVYKLEKLFEKFAEERDMFVISHILGAVMRDGSADRASIIKYLTKTYKSYTGLDIPKGDFSITQGAGDKL